MVGNVDSVVDDRDSIVDVAAVAVEIDHRAKGLREELVVLEDVGMVLEEEDQTVHGSSEAREEEQVVVEAVLLMEPVIWRAKELATWSNDR